MSPSDLGSGTFGDCTSDGELAVIRLPSGVLRLVAVGSGREPARLEGPDSGVAAVHFAPDGARLVLQVSDGMRVWDLRGVRQELAKLGLDWDAPVYLPTRQESDDALSAELCPGSSQPHGFGL